MGSWLVVGSWSVGVDFFVCLGVLLWFDFGVGGLFGGFLIVFFRTKPHTVKLKFGKGYNYAVGAKKVYLLRIYLLHS